MANVTPNLCCRRRANDCASACRLIWELPRAIRVGWSLDSEGENERSQLEQQPALRPVGRKRAGCRWPESEPRDDDCACNVRRRGARSAVLADEHDRVAVDRAVVVGTDAGRRCLRLVLARTGHPRARVTPYVAQQGGVLPGGQCQHDGKEGCSKHVATRGKQEQDLRQPLPRLTA